MAYPYTRSRARSELADSDVEPSDTAPSAATCPLPPSIFLGPNVVAAERPESVSTESAGPVSAPTLSSSGRPSLLAQSRYVRVCGSFSSGGLRPSYPMSPSGLADPPDSSMHSGSQMSTGLATGIVAAESMQTDQSSTSSSRQPPATAAAETAAAEGPTVAPTYDRLTRRAQSLSARTSSFHSLSPPVLSPTYDVELPQSVPLCRERVASSQRAVSQRAPSLSSSQSTFSYGAPSPAVGSGREVQYPAARPSVFRPRLIDIWADAVPTPLPRPAAASVDRARPVAASVDVGHMSLPYANVDVNVRRPGSALAHAYLSRRRLCL